MVNLKDDFRDWLIKQGLSEKTATGRHGTIYKYVRRIDKLCNRIYKGYDLQPWQQLAEDIYPILGFHLLCRKGDVCVTQNNIAEIKDFLNTFLSDLRQYQDNLKNYFEVKLLLDDGDYVEQYTFNQMGKRKLFVSAKSFNPSHIICCGGGFIIVLQQPIFKIL